MKNYTTQTASLKATTIDTRLLDAKQIDTKKLFINGTQFDPSQIKESPNEAMFQLIISPVEDRDYVGVWAMESVKEGQYDISILSILQKGSETEGQLENGVYVVVPINDNFVKCIGGNSVNDTDLSPIYKITSAKFNIIQLTSTLPKFEQCILENFITVSADTNEISWVIKLCEEDDNLSELYGGITEDNSGFPFSISIPYYIPENDDTSSSSTYSLRNTNIFDNLRENFEEMSQRSLDKSAE